jgi:hypothetical protein
MDSPFDSAWLKWGWGVVHAQALDTEILTQMDDFQKRQPFIARTEYRPKHHCVSLVIESIEPLAPILGLRAGDVINNFRAALDQLAWAVVTTRGIRAFRRGEPSRVYFPIALVRDDFDSHLVVSQFLTRADRAIFRRYQPYVHGKRNVPLHPLTPLPDLNRYDKHRVIQPVAMWPKGGTLYHGVESAVDCTVTRVPQRARGVVMQPGAEIQRIYVRRTGPNPNLYMEAHLAVHPTLDGRIPLGEWLTKTTAHIRNLLREFAEPPEEILTLGIVPASQRRSPSRG